MNTSNEPEKPLETTPETEKTEANQASDETSPQPESKDRPVANIPKADKEKRSADRLRDMRKKVPLGPGNFWNNMLSTVLLLILITALFS